MQDRLLQPLLKIQINPNFLNLLHLFLITVLFFTVTKTLAQQLPFAHLSIADGLEDTVIFSTVQDSQGFLWISTRTGINRFDGEKFWTFGRNNGLPHNLARDMLLSKQGKLWVANEKGVAWFDGTSFQVVKKWPENTSARAIAESEDGSLWVATYGAGLLRIQMDIQNTPNITQQFNQKNGLSSNRVRSLLVDDSGNIWVGMSNEVARIKGNQIETIAWHADESEIRTFYQNTDGRIWAGTRHGLAIFKNGAFEPLDLGVDLSKQTINAITRDQSGNIWLGTRDYGVYRFDADYNYSHMDMLDGLPDNSVNSIYQDNEGNMWFGTYGGGLARLSTSKVLNWKAQSGMPAPNVYAITDDPSGCIWIGTNGNGISRLCEEEMTHMTTKDGLPHNKILSTVIDNKGDPWFGTLEGISQYIDNKFVNYGENEGLVSYHIIQAKDHTFWVATNKGLYHFDGISFRQFSQSDGLPDNRINRIIESQKGGLWLASANGLTRYHNQQFTSWSTDDGLPANFINDFYEDKNGGLWIASNNGLSYFFNGVFENWSTNEGLPHNNCTVILPGKGDDIWIGTSRGVAIFDGQDFTVITSREGLVFDLVNRGAGFRDKKGNLWFGTGEGISQFASDFKPGSSTPPPVHLLSVSNNLVEVDLSKPIEIKQDDSSLHFSYSAISFQRAPDVNYRYRLSNSGNSPWRNTRLRELQIDSLSAGDYRFEITARIGKGTWNPQSALYHFTIIPPFWQTLWFVVLVFFVFIASILYRSYRSRQRAIQLEYCIQERTKQLEEVNLGLEWLANHDNLTRLANRNCVHKKLENLPLNNSNLLLGIIIIDLDYFKNINDNFGHTMGDKALKAFADMLIQQTREDQLTARWGGEEFLIVCPQINANRLQALAMQILTGCRQLTINSTSGEPVSLRCSLGFALTPYKHSHTWENTIKLADQALYDAKHQGRNCGFGYLWENNLPKDFDYDQVILNLKNAFEHKYLTKIRTS